MKINDVCLRFQSFKSTVLSFKERVLSEMTVLSLFTHPRVV